LTLLIALKRTNKTKEKSLTKHSTEIFTTKNSTCQRLLLPSLTFGNCRCFFGKRSDMVI